MKAEIKASGYLVVYAENELEAYALSRWAGENLQNYLGDDTKRRDFKVLINTSFNLNK